MVSEKGRLMRTTAEVPGGEREIEKLSVNTIIRMARVDF